MFKNFGSYLFSVFHISTFLLFYISTFIYFSLFKNLSLFYIFIIYFLQSVEFYCVFLFKICPLCMIFTFNFCNFWFHSFIHQRPHHIEFCQVSFNLDYLMGWYMKEWLTENIKMMIFIAQNWIFWTCHFVKFERKHIFKLCKLHLLKQILYDISKAFLAFVSVDLLHQMTGLSLYVEKLIQTSPHTHTHT